MKKNIFYLVMALSLIACRKKVDKRDALLGTWQVVSLQQKTDSTENNSTNVCTLHFDKEETENGLFNKITFGNDAFALQPLSDIRNDQCLDYYGSYYGCYWYIDDYRLFIWGIGPLKDHVEYCTLSLDKSEMTLLHVKASPNPASSGNTYTLKQKIMLRKQ